MKTAERVFVPGALDNRRTTKYNIRLGIKSTAAENKFQNLYKYMKIVYVSYWEKGVISNFFITA